jgi:peptide/nickel transport system substrate-binding protein
MRHLIGCCLLLLGLTACELSSINSPYTEQLEGESVLYSSFSLRPKHLDPARSYSSSEAQFTAQIYEPPLQYHYLKRPYTLIPLSARQLPTVNYYNAEGIRLEGEIKTQDIAYSIYEVSIKSGIHYQPHPAFSRKTNGEFEYHSLNDDELTIIKTLSDFKNTDTRELVAADYVYQIKRLAHPDIHSPILSLMAEHIVGLTEFSQQLRQQKQKGQHIDLKNIDISGVALIDKYRYQIKVKGKYPQLNYWLAMPFFAPMPWEADLFYQQKGLKKKNISLDWYPVGTGPYYLTENNPNRRMVLTKNPNFHGELYPTEGEAGDQTSGLLEDAGKEMPFINKVVFSLEKESIPLWNKFLQGYYDASGINSDSFDQAIQVGVGGDFNLSKEMIEKNIKLKTAIETSTFYMGFNMLDSVVGGYSERAQKLRQAISIAIDYEEYVSIFTNGRGTAAQGPIPPGMFGHIEGKEGINPYVYEWQTNLAKRKPINDAKQLLTEAGYPNGRDEKMGKPLTLHLDVPASGPDAKARFDWIRKQFQKLDIQLVIRNTDYNRFQEKMRKGQAQIFQWGWNADYPDPENFLFLLYGPNGKVNAQGENAANYQNIVFDELFEKMRTMDNGNERQKIIDQMLSVLHKDSPWIWGFHPKQFYLYHAWNKNIKPNLMANNTLKYRRLDAELRQQQQQQWNAPILWPLAMVFLIILVLLIPAITMYRNKNYTKIMIEK